MFCPSLSPRRRLAFLAPLFASLSLLLGALAGLLGLSCIIGTCSASLGLLLGPFWVLLRVSWRSLVLRFGALGALWASLLVFCVFCYFRGMFLNPFFIGPPSGNQLGGLPPFYMVISRGNPRAIFFGSSFAEVILWDTGVKPLHLAMQQILPLNRYVSHLELLFGFNIVYVSGVLGTCLRFMVWRWA